MPESSVRTQTSMPAARTCSTAPMWSQWPWVSSTEVTPNWVATRSNRSCSLAASINVASPVLRHRTTYTLFWMGPTTKRCTSAAASDQTSSTLSIPQTATPAGSKVWLISIRRRKYSPVGDRGIAMNFGFSEEQEELRKMVKRFMEEKSPETEVRRLMATDEGYDPDVWKLMANELALQGLGIPEVYGGQGYGPVELYVVFEEMGAALFCAPYFSSVALAANAVLFVGTDADKAKYLPGIASGETIATVALTDDTGDWDVAATSTVARHSSDGWVINGVRNYVTDGNTSSILFVPAMTDAGLSLFAVQGDAVGVTREALPTMDQTRKQSRIELKDAPATLV